jgi:hypothetical protein
MPDITIDTVQTLEASLAHLERLQTQVRHSTFMCVAQTY